MATNPEEAADLEAAEGVTATPADAVSQEPVADAGGDDLSAYFEASDREEEIGASDFDDGEDEEPTAVIAAADSETLPEPELEALPTEESQETPTPSDGDLTREDLVKMLRQANAELEKVRAPVEGAEAQAQGVSQETAQVVQDPAEIRQAAQTHLEQSYAMTTEDADSLLTNPEQMMPKLLARSHLSMMEQTAQMIRAAVPTLIRNTLDQTQQATTWEENFFKDWQGLLPHKKEVVRVRDTLKQLYPDSTPEQRDKEVGSFLSMRHGIVPRAVPTPAKGQRRTTAVPHTPMGRGPTSAGRPTASTTKNYFTQLAESDLEDD